jgi:hypothetical protein
MIFVCCARGKARAESQLVGSQSASVEVNLFGLRFKLAARL